MDGSLLEEAVPGVQQHISRDKSREATLCINGGEEFQFKIRQC